MAVNELQLREDHISLGGLEKMASDRLYGQIKGDDGS